MAEYKIDIEKSAQNILDRVQQKLGISAEQLMDLVQVTAERDEYKELFFSYKHVCGGIEPQRIGELVEADKAGRCVVLPFPLHRMLLNTSDPYNPELLKDFRISATWTHCGIVFHSPWDIFLQNIEKGYIRLMREEAEAMLEGGTPDAEAD